MYTGLAILAVFTFAFSLLSARIDRLPTSAPVVFVLAGVLLGPLGLGWFSDDMGRSQFRILVDLTLAVILFTDAANSNLNVLRRNWKLPARMLGIGLPGSMLLGALLAMALFEVLSPYEAAVVGVMLAATDAALGKAVVTNEKVPASLRETLNCESGLNDGLCVPFLLVFLALASGGEGESASRLVAEELGIGAAVGASLAVVGGWLLRESHRRGWISSVWLQLCLPSLALCCFAIAQSMHGSGYIAAFVGGIVFGAIAKDGIHQLAMPAEGIGEAMAMLTWMGFGVLVIGQSLPLVTWPMLLFAVLSLTVVRMLPVAISLVGSGESAANVAFLGWFGPRGLASVVFAIMVVEAELANSALIAMIVTCTVALSLLLHGVTANPLADRISRTGASGTE